MSFVTPFLATRFNVFSKIMSDILSVYTPIGESILAKRVHKNCHMFVLHKVIPCDLVKLDMVDFDITLGIELLYVSYAFINYRTHRVKFQLPNEPIFNGRVVISV